LVLDCKLRSQKSNLTIDYINNLVLS
jgi:hypothetical protein